MDMSVHDSPKHERLRTPKGEGRSPRARGSAWRHVPTLMRKNWLLKKKRPVRLLFEVFTPVILILLLAWIKAQTTEQNYLAGFGGDESDNDLFQPYGYTPAGSSYSPRYAIPETTLTGLLLYMARLSFDSNRDMQTFGDEKARAICERELVYGGRISLNKSSSYAVPSECQDHVSLYKLAIAPDNAFTRAYFFDTVKEWYPTLEINVTSNATLVVPSLEDSVVFYDTEEDLENYIKSATYGKTMEQPRIFGALVFNEFPGDASIGSYAPIDYSIRMNGTDTEVGFISHVPSTKSGDASTWFPFRRGVDTAAYKLYASGGFMTLQTLVTRFVNCMPKWDSKAKVSTGECQASSSLASASNDLDNRLLQTVKQDPSTKRALSELMGDRGMDTTIVKANSFDLPLSKGHREVLLKPLRQAPQPYLGATTSPFPSAAYSTSDFYRTFKSIMPLFFTIAYQMVLSKIIVTLISERETRSRELMKILGVKESSLVISWYLTHGLILLVSCIFQALMATSLLFEESDMILVFLFFFLFSLSFLAYGFMVSSMFSKARTGGYVGIIGFVVMYAVSNAFNDMSSESSKNAASLLSPTAFAFAIQVLSEVETAHVGIQFSNASALVNRFRFSSALWMFVFDTFLYTLIGMYLEKVVPKTHGTTEKWYFPVMPSYWRRRRGDMSNESRTHDETAVHMEPNVEPVSADLAEQERTGAALCVQGLSKVFSVPGGEKVAVDDLQLNMYSGQITCLLGHNGAGKTTLISILTGMLNPTAGDATFRGLSIRRNMDEIRESLGICFQHDVLYPELTVEEHLQFYARIKGYSGTELDNEVTHKINEVGLSDKRKTISSALSGGMKRKLSVAISLLGDSSLVFLDEPTSGMDPYSRRSTWEILMNNRHNRVLVLTTHFMDEADILGDRIAIMAEGQLRCCGSSLFLKNRYGAGYNLTIVKEEGCDDAKVCNFVLGHIPGGRVLSNVGMEIAFQLPLETSAQFPSLFNDIDANLENLQVRSYGISVTTMEEVFIKVAEAANDEDVSGHQKLVLGNSMKTHKVQTMDSGELPILGSTDSPVVKSKPTSMFALHLIALVQKRYRIAKRDKRFGFVSLFLPIALLVSGIALLKAGTLSKPNLLMPLSIDSLQLQLPSYCDQPSEDWCNKVFSSSDFTGGAPVILGTNDIGNPPYANNSPTVLGFQYYSPSFNHTGTTGQLLKLTQVIYDRAIEQGVDNQFGGFLVHADSKSRVLSYNVLVNTTLDHGSAVFKGLMDQSIYRIMASEASPSVDVSKLYLKVNNYPLPQSVLPSAPFSSYLGILVCLLIVIAFVFFPAPIVTLLVKERQAEHNSKHQQLVSGVNLLGFWLSNYLWDLLVYIIPGGIALLLIQVFDVAPLSGSSDCVSCTSETFPAVVVLFVLFGLAICPYSYSLSFLLRQHTSAQNKAITFNFLFGLVFIGLSLVLELIPDVQVIGRALKWVFRLCPIYNLGNGLLIIVSMEMARNGATPFETAPWLSPFSTENAGYEILSLGVDAVLLFGVAVGIDYARSFPKVKSMFTKKPSVESFEEIEDTDVVAEAKRVATGQADGDMIMLQNLRKVYPNGDKVAVKNLSFGLKRGECFGFLGINGAGKTTTMKMLTGDIVPTSGSATLAGFDILSQQIDIRREIGYCPQFDALIDLLSVREHLELFAQIKGVPRSELDEVVREKMQQLNLTAFEHKLAGSLSGGNKRKLSVAIAMIGSPSILFLDEPSTGMDPVSRRFMWDVISEISTYNKQSTVVLTTHSMEECEALCTRVGIMVGGGLKCLGSVQHLKHRFGDGLMFDAKLLPAPVSEVESLVLRHFDSLDARISALELSDVCRRFGESAWEEKLVETHPTGFLVASALRRDGYVLAGSFASWWLTEVRFAGVERFLSSNFARVELLERQNESCRFKLHDVAIGDRVALSRLSLGHVFGLLESSKASLAIREYSVSQTTLEQIFNTFASQQHAENPMDVL